MAGKIPDSKREEILSTLRTELLKISRGNRFRTDIKRVTFHQLSDDQINDDFVIAIHAGATFYTSLTNCSFTVGRDRQDQDGWMIGLVLYRRLNLDSDKEGLGTLELERASADVKNLITGNSTLGLGYLKHIRPHEEVDLVDVGVFSPVAKRLLTLSVKYDFEAGKS